jgi:hypothetical protein
MSLLSNVDLPEPSDFDDRNVRERIEDQREADFYREDPEDIPLDETEREENAS